MYKTILWKQRRRKEIREKVEKTLIRIIFVLMFLLGIYGFYCGIQQQLEHVQAAGLTPAQMINSGEIYRVECTAYDNEEGNLTASGRPTVEGLTMAGAREWLGCTCILYDENMNFVGFYEFTDTGYGRDGDIERGETIDIYMDSHEEALQWAGGSCTSRSYDPKDRRKDDKAFKKNEDQAISKLAAWIGSRGMFRE